MDGKHTSGQRMNLSMFIISLGPMWTHYLASVICNIYPHWSSYSLYAFAALRMAAARKYADYSISRICRFIQLEFAFAICTPSSSSRSLSSGHYIIYFYMYFVLFLWTRPAASIECCLPTVLYGIKRIKYHVVYFRLSLRHSTVGFL